MTQAIEWLFEHDIYLLEANAAERAIAARVATYLAPHFPELHVDVEYNRHGIEPKRVHLNTYRGARKLIVPDIIVHQRGTDERNLLVIQIKKETNREPRTHDVDVLRAMKQEFAFHHALLLDLPAGPGATTRRAVFEWR